MRASVPLKLGDALAISDPRVLELYSVDLCEDSQTVAALYYLADGATGYASWHWRGTPDACGVVYVAMDADE